MYLRTELKNKIFSVDDENFNSLAISIFNYQVNNNNIYRKYIELLGIKPAEIIKVSEIPFLPVEIYKTQKVVSGNLEIQKIFESSRTAGSAPSIHYISDLGIYDTSLTLAFKQFFGNPDDYVFLALLPSYLERSNSSLVYMVNSLMKMSGQKIDAWFLYNFEELYKRIIELKKGTKKIFLIGVAFALLDFAIEYQPNLKGHIVMETGGMKGRKKEIVRQEMHDQLKFLFNIENITSEYGMTEMLSQSYAIRDGHFFTPPWLKILIRESNDPFTWSNINETGYINIIDLANLDSCSFLALQDVGKINTDGSFEILGRADYSDIRGCGLMYL